MPTVYRSMKAAADGLPVVGNQSKELGVRVPPNPSADIDVDPNTQMVLLNGAGMSVAANWRLLKPHLVPARLSGIVPKARGSDNLKCYRLGDGPFALGALADGLELVLKSSSSILGNVAPNSAMTVAEFQTKIAATRTDWVVDET